MLMSGSQITQPGDQLRKISPEALFQAISSPKQEFRDMLRQISILSTVDKNQYAAVKKKLPYFVCGIFHPPYRKKENFAAIDYFVIDIDHIVSSGKNIGLLSEKLKASPELMMMFRSPSGDGLKVMFRLSVTCKDAPLFSAFYKVFAMQFAEQYGINNIVDFRTSDVTRACFLSFDPDAYYNPVSVPIEMSSYIRNLSFDLAEKDIKETEQKIREQVTYPSKTTGPDADILREIRSKLNPSIVSLKKEYYVPGQIDKAVPLIQAALESYNMQLIEASPISFGNKLKIKAGSLWAEVNVFFGKKGFSVVKTTKTGSNAELAELAAQTVSMILKQNYIE